MVRIDTLRRSLFALVPFTALVTAACSGGAGTDPQGAGGDPAAAENGATTAGLSEEGGDNPPNAAVTGKEGEDPDFERFAGSVTPDTTPDHPGTPGVGSTSSALGTARGLALVNEARREFNTLNKSTSYYSHTTYVNEANGTRRVDCSGFVDYILTRVMPDAYAKVPHPNTSRPLAEDWYNYIVGRYTNASTQTSVRWRKIMRVTDLKPGDLVVWLKPPSVVTNNTGHIMVVNNVPRAGRAAKGEVLVDVIDSTATPHANDSRGTTHTGIGTATIGLKVDANGFPTHYYWSGGVSSTAVSTKITLGRVE